MSDSSLAVQAAAGAVTGLLMNGLPEPNMNRVSPAYPPFSYTMTIAAAADCSCDEHGHEDHAQARPSATVRFLDPR
jgi:hypothetical protein